ncbi:hypothetical protein PR202_gb25917 [Eleusine coracana subsp. coracana]|uniref:Gfo/Idh/MocA-like oxidoreductase C-terminal domain-containing protein n=1 Tax=Eleusine coracana subsp. coracana TaxID=191504 RepID=A0AAV5FMX7_ELECO|nr:hypothetical protein PR202_gb25917 [Eleusine coracana subsp. coracana]
MWHGSDVVNGGHCLVAWPRVSVPTELGGLGIHDLMVMGLALRMRYDWLQPTDPNRVLVDLPCQSGHAVEVMFEASVTVRVGDGSRTRF